MKNLKLSAIAGFSLAAIILFCGCIGEVDDG